MNLPRLFLQAGRGFCVLAAFGLLAGCNSRQQDAPTSATNQASAPQSGPASTPVVDMSQSLPPGLTPMTEADRAWEEVVKSMQPPSAPPEWETNRPSKEALAEFQKKQGALASEGAARLEAFYTKHTTSEHAAEAREMEQRLLSVAAQLGSSNALQRLQTLDEARLKDPKLSEDEFIQIKVEMLQRGVMGLLETNVSAGLTQLEKGVRGLQQQFTNRAELAGLLVGVAESWLDAGLVDKARTLAQEAAAATKEAEVQEAAQGLLKKLERLGQPLALKFKAIDGREFDLQAMKGKVVLVDFWATWCGPCMAELPKVKEAYARLNPKGFEIVGISFDREKAPLEKTVASEKMTWPQHFDAGSEGKPFGEEFQIASIPTMWLVDKKGNLRELNARENLVEKVEKLLAE